MRGLTVILGGLAVWFLSGEAACAGKLRQAREEVREKEEKKPKSKNKSAPACDSARKYPYSDCQEDDESWFTIILNFGSRKRREALSFDGSTQHWHGYDPLAVPGAVAYGSHVTLDTWDPAVEMNSGPNFAHFPYADGHDGYMFYDQENIRAEQQGASIQFNYGSDFEALSWWTGKLLAETSTLWNVYGDWTFLQEDVGSGQADEMHLGDANLMFRVGESEYGQTYVGLGLNWLHDSVATDVGFNGSLKFNLFPEPPFILSGEVDYGSLGRTDQLHLALSTGVIWNHLELFGGYDYRKIGSVDWSGPSFGLRYWW